ncbi:MAG TPA: hypothetical protein VF228_04250 [Iamia sp.]
MDLGLDLAPPPAPEVVAPASALVPKAALAVTLAGCAMVLWAASAPFGDIGWYLMGGLFLAAAGLVWSAGVVLAIVDVFRDRPTVPMRWIVGAMAAVVLTVALVWFRVPFSMRWADSRAEFAAVVAEAEPGLAAAEERDMGGPRRLGTYDVSWVRQQGEAVVFGTDGGLFRDEGIAYVPDGSDRGLEVDGFEAELTSIGGRWYLWSTLTD